MGAKAIDLTGKTFGYLTIIERGPNKGKNAAWYCKCNCGNKILVKGTSLRNGHTKSCGCYSKEKASLTHLDNLTGRRFNRLIVVERVENKGNKVRWKCKCDCGNEVIVLADSLRRGHTQSCGCLQKERVSEFTCKDLKNMRFGKLIALYPTDTRNLNGAIIWHCKCDCGKEKNVSSVELIAGRVKSCGCIKRSSGEERISSLLNNNNITYKSEFNISINNANYRFDFAIIENNKVKYFIEFDGKQHFLKDHGYDFWGGSYIETHNRDLIKNKYCFDNNIPLIRIPFTILDIHMEDLLLKTSKFIITCNNEKEYYTNNV